MQEATDLSPDWKICHSSGSGCRKPKYPEKAEGSRGSAAGTHTAFWHSWSHRSPQPHHLFHFYPCYFHRFVQDDSFVLDRALVPDVFALTMRTVKLASFTNGLSSSTHIHISGLKNTSKHLQDRSHHVKSPFSIPETSDGRGPGMPSIRARA